VPGPYWKPKPDDRWMVEWPIWRILLGLAIFVAVAALRVLVT
jgi:hypothetical protein